MQKYEKKLLKKEKNIAIKNKIMILLHMFLNEINSQSSQFPCIRIELISKPINNKKS